MKKLLALCFAVLFLPMTTLGQGERYNLSLGDYRYQRYNTLDTNTPNYTIVRGDNLWDLASRFYGAGQEWRYIWEHNTYIRDPHWIYPGDPLFIPGMPQAVAPMAQVQPIAPPPIIYVQQPFQLEFSDIFGDTSKIYDPKNDSVQTQEPEQTDTIAQTIEIIEIIPETTDTILKVKNDKKRYFVLSLRGETINAINIPKNDETSKAINISGIGGSMELGAISGRGFYFSLDLSGGKFYYGGGFDMGGCMGKDKGVKSVIGVFGGYWTFMNSMEVIKNGSIIAAAEGKNMSYGGGFWKLMFGKTFNIDITNKCFVVLKDEPTGWDNEKEKFTYEKGIKPMWSGSAGFTFSVKKKKLGR